MRALKYGLTCLCLLLIAGPVGRVVIRGSAAEGAAGARSDVLDHGSAPTAAALLEGIRLRRAQTLYATVATNGLDLHWSRGWEENPAANARNYYVERRSLGSTNWTVVATNLLTDTWRDTNIAPGSSYEYRLPRPGTTDDARLWPYLVAGRKATPIESRGKVILLVDNSVAPDLVSDLNTFASDLIGDGWTVARHDVARHTNYWGNDPSHLLNATNLYYRDNLLKNRQIISNEWRLNPNGTNVVILLGHVTVPYSGSIAEDGHTDPRASHVGAWPADLWYADVDGQWSDTNSNYSMDPFLRNVGGDFKWDADTASGLTFEVSVGRIDFDDLPAFRAYVSPPATDGHDLEVKLLRRYLAKDHAYRRGDYAFDASLRFYDDEKYASRSFAQMRTEAARVAGAFFGHELSQLSSDDAFRRSTTSRSPTLWAFHGGFGHLQHVQASFGNVRTVEDLAPQNCVGDFAFGMLSGSWFGDWNLPYDELGAHDNNLLRSCLAQPTNALAVMWSLGGRNGPWTFPTQALGDPLAPALLATLRSGGNQSVRTTFILGDPTLRFAQVKPVKGLTVTRKSGKAVLKWSASGTPGAGYWVYASTNLGSPTWTRLTAGSPLTALSYTAPDSKSSSRYMVRAVALQTTGSGSYTNLSQGTFVTAP